MSFRVKFAAANGRSAKGIPSGKSLYLIYRRDFLPVKAEFCQRHSFGRNDKNRCSLGRSGATVRKIPLKRNLIIKHLRTFAIL